MSIKRGTAMVGDKVQLEMNPDVVYVVSEVFNSHMVRLQYEREDGKMVDGGIADISVLKRVDTRHGEYK